MPPDGSPIETRRVCATEAKEVAWEEIAKGYELAGRPLGPAHRRGPGGGGAATEQDDRHRVIRANTGDRPLYFDRPYLLVPSDEGAARAYALLCEAMGDVGQAALGRFVLRARERLVSVRSREGVLTLTTMRFHDEVRPADEVAREIHAARPTREQVERAVAVIEELAVDFDATSYRDEHRAHLLRILKSKQKGKKIAAPVQPSEPVTTAPDLMGALEQSLAQIRGEKKKKRLQQKARSARAGAGSKRSGSTARGA